MPSIDTTTLFTIAGLLGVFFEVGAYAALQIGLIHGNGYGYTLANLTASVFLLLSLIAEFNISYFVIDIIFLALSLYGLARIFLLDRRARLTPEEIAFVAGQFPSMSRTMAHSFLSAGSWHHAEAGVRLATEGETLGALIYLASGEADIMSHGMKIAHCLPTSFIGELTCFDGGPASADVVLSTAARYFRIDTEALNRLCGKDFEMRQAVQFAIGNDTRKKLLEANQQLRGAPAT